MGLIPRRRGGPKRRRRFSLNGLAIQLSAFALSFTLVALLVVSGSQAAFVEESEVFADYVPIGAAGSASGSARKPAARPAPPPAPAPQSPAPESPSPEPVEEPAEEVELSDSDEGTAMFAGGIPLAPGSSSDRCIEVTYTGEDEEMSPVLLYAAATSGELAPYLDLTVDVGRAEDGTFGNCADFTASDTLFEGTLADFAATHSSYATGRTTWLPSAAEEARAFRFRVAVQDVPAAAGLSASFGFTWRTEAA
ncbi:MAG: hypothetical protein M3Q22_12070 [Actinomycetota bacterium]|nr:hypothetical protein [Actinomycetota bacterium]